MHPEHQVTSAKGDRRRRWRRQWRGILNSHWNNGPVLIAQRACSAGRGVAQGSQFLLFSCSFQFSDLPQRGNAHFGQRCEDARRILSDVGLQGCNVFGIANFVPVQKLDLFFVGRGNGGNERWDNRRHGGGDSRLGRGGLRRGRCCENQGRTQFVIIGGALNVPDVLRKRLNLLAHIAGNGGQRKSGLAELIKQHAGVNGGFRGVVRAQLVEGALAVAGRIHDEVAGRRFNPRQTAR